MTDRSSHPPPRLARVARHAGFRILCGVIQTSRGVVVVPLLARTLGLEDFGHLSLAIALWMMLFAIAVEPFQEIVIRECAREPAQEGGILAAARRAQAALALVCIPIAFLVGAALGGPRTGALSLILAAGLLCSAMASPSLVLAVRLRGEWVMLARLIADGAFVVGVVVAAALGAGVFCFAALYLANTAIDSGLGMLFSRRYLSTTVASATPPLVRLALPLMGGRLTRSMNRHLGVVMLSALAGASAAGIFAAADRLVRAGLDISSAIASALMPLFACFSRAELRRRMVGILFACGGLGATLSLGYWLLAPLVPRVFGVEYAPAAELLPVLGLVAGIACVTAPFATGLIAAERQAIVAWADLAALVANLAVLVPALSLYGLRGAAIAAVVAASAQICVLGCAATRLSGAGLRGLTPAEMPALAGK